MIDDLTDISTFGFGAGDTTCLHCVILPKKRRNEE
jgi:hypothetical protein